jgi:glutathione-regulated potassium-efflux system ancillary protein KefC
MDFGPTLISVDYQDPAWIAIAFAFGLLVKQVGLPPMVGFLAAGFMLHLLGVENDRFLLEVADMGVTLLLFTIGLKLRLGAFMRPVIWATMSLHMAASTGVAAALLAALAIAGAGVFAGLDLATALIVAFALSFSSTVFAVKTLEERGAVASRYGQTGIGILVLQDIAAVAFLAASTGKAPSLWAVALLALIPLRHVLGWLLNRTGHTELLTVYGFVLALGGAAVFEVVQLKGDLGALVFGVLLSSHAKAGELAKTLMGFKDVFLVCFFLTIGLTGLPSWETAAAALVLLMLIPMKSALYFWLLTRFGLRARGATLGSLLLGNYSEFGLIVCAIAIDAGWLAADWLTVTALAVSASFVLASPMNMFADRLYAGRRAALKRFERGARLPGDEDIDLRHSRVLVFGMGRVGRAAYDEMRPHVDGRILGIDLDESQVARNVAEGRRVVLGDATNPEFWSRLEDRHDHIDMILLAMPNQSANVAAAARLRERGYGGPMVATARYPDQEDELRANGADEVFNIYSGAGTGAAARMGALMDLEPFGDAVTDDAIGRMVDEVSGRER